MAEASGMNGVGTSRSTLKLLSPLINPFWILIDFTLSNAPINVNPAGGGGGGGGECGQGAEQLLKFYNQIPHGGKLTSIKSVKKSPNVGQRS